jgi:hypothetical protein
MADICVFVKSPVAIELVLDLATDLMLLMMVLLASLAVADAEGWLWSGFGTRKGNECNRQRV